MNKALQVPNGWKPTKIKDAAQVNPRSNSVDDDTLVTFLPMNAVSESGTIQGVELRKAIDVKKGFTSFETGDVLVAKITPCFENYKGCLCTELKNDRGYGSTEFHILRPKKSITGEYLHVLTRTHHFRGAGELNMTGTAGQKRVPTIFLKNYDFSLPPLPEQKAIADLLSTWDEAIEKTERLIQAKEKRFKWLLRELISEPRNIWKDMECERVKLGEVCKIITSNADKKTALNETPVSLCNYMDVYKNYYITNKLGFMSASATTNEIEKYQLRIHDVLLTKDSETPDDIANSACVLDAPENLLCGYHLAILRPKKYLFGPYLNFALHTPRIRYEFSCQANGATRFGLTMSAYNMVELPLPSLEKQKAIAEALTASQHEIGLLKQLTGKYKTQKHGLMQKMLTGEWRVKPEIVNQYIEA